MSGGSEDPDAANTLYLGSTDYVELANLKVRRCRCAPCVCKQTNTSSACMTHCPCVMLCKSYHVLLY